MKVFLVSVWMEWDVLRRSLIGGCWAGSTLAAPEWEIEEVGGGGRKGNRRGCLAETHARILLLQPQKERLDWSLYASPPPPINTLCVRIFDQELRVTAPLAHIPPQDLRISGSSCSTRERCFPSPTPPTPTSGQTCQTDGSAEISGSFSESVDDLMAKPECRNMDACLRRLKQELVRPVWYRHCHQYVAFIRTRWNNYLLIWKIWKFLICRVNNLCKIDVDVMFRFSFGACVCFIVGIKLRSAFVSAVRTDVYTSSGLLLSSRLFLKESLVWTCYQSPLWSLVTICLEMREYLLFLQTHHKIRGFLKRTTDIQTHWLETKSCKLSLYELKLSGLTKNRSDGTN